MSLNAICIVFVVVEHIKDELVETHELEQEAGAGLRIPRGRRKA